MKIAMIALCIVVYVTPDPSFARSPKDPHHLMWTSTNGTAKCANKGSKEKADKCAAKMRAKNVADVQVMAGRCKGT